MATTTALMPIDAASPQRVTRILPIRANLLPPEVTAGRNARRTRIVLIGAAALVVILQGLWYLFAIQQKQDADAELAATTQQVTTIQSRKREYTDLTNTINQDKAIKGQLTTLLADDLPWATTLDTVRSTGTKAGATVDSISGTLVADDDPTASSDAVVMLSISGSAPDKKTVANYVDALRSLTWIANPFLSVATEADSAASESADVVTFTLSAEVTSKALCGRFTTACKTGGK
jgi:hypothetical protein